MKLGVILEQGGSLETMRRSGQEDRLLYYFERYHERFDDVVFFSYGDTDGQDAGPARVVAPKHRWSPTLYSCQLPFRHRKELSSCSLLRVLQTSGIVPAAITKALYRVPCVVTHGYDAESLATSPWSRHLARLQRWLAFRSADVILCTTESLRDRARAARPERRVELLPNGVDLRLFRSSAVRATPEGPWKILSVGRLSPEKNYPLLVDAAARLSRVELHLVGDGPEAPALTERARALGLPLVLHGVVPQIELPALYGMADVFVLSSRSEGHPKSLLEAMATGTPCIGTDVSGTRDVLTHRRTGLLAGESADSLAQALEEILTDRELASKLAEAAAEEARERHSLERVLDRELEILASALASRQPIM